MSSKRILCVLALLLASPVAAEAQEAEPAKARAVGVVRTAAGISIPCATLRLTHLDSGRAWVSWSDENGKFDLPGLPVGRYRIEARQLGFDPAATQPELSADPQPPLELILRVAALAAQKPAETPTATEPAKNPVPPAETAEAKTEAAKPPQPGTDDTQRNATGTGTAPATGEPVPPNARGQPLPPNLAEAVRQRFGQGQGGLQQVDPTAQGGLPGDPSQPQAGGSGDAGPLGEASSSDAFLIRGTVGRAVPQGGDATFGGFGPGLEGGFPGQGGMPGGLGGLVGIIMPGGQQGPAQPGQRQGRGGRGQGRGEPDQGQNQRGAGAQGQTGETRQVRPGGAPGPGGFGQGMEGLWGMQRILRQQVNRLRLSFFNRYGNSLWDARPYSLTEPDPAKIDTYRESLGLNVGGPLRLPKLYDGREKTFFFANYEMGRNRIPVDTFSTVPLPAERRGDFSARGAQLFDPNSNLSGPRAPLGSAIPGAMLDPAAVGLLPFIPLPNLPGTVQNFHLQTRVPQATDRANLRLLHTVSPRLSFQAVYSLASTRSQGVQSFPALISRTQTRGQNVNLGLTQQWTRRFLHDTRVHWSRNHVQTLNRFAFRNDVAGSLGIAGISADPVNFGVPRLDFTNFTDASDPIPALRRNQTLRFLDNFSYALPKHTLRAGLEIRRIQNNHRTDPTARGAFAFTGLMTSQLDALGRPIPGTGFDFADFLLGLPQSTTVRFGSSSTYFRSWGFVGYVQDDWRLHPRFSVNWGLRYEAVTPPAELFDKIANLDLDSAITAVATVLPGQTAPFSGALPRSLIRGDYNNWSPRLGLAWRPATKRSMTVRAGYALFYNTWIYNQLSASMANQPPHAQAQTRLTSSTRVLTLQNGFPPAPPGTVPNTIAVDPDYRIGYAQIWNLSVETQIVPGVVAEITYTGTKGTHLDLLRSPNRALPTGPLNTELTRRIPNAPGFTFDTFGASSIYHALQLRVQRRMSRGFQVQGLYTFGRSIDNASSIGGGAPVVVQDDTRFDAERGLSAFDIRHQFRANYVYELPFGEQKRWARRGWQAMLLGNWQISGNTSIQTGTPFTARLLGSAANNSGTGNNFSERADQVGSPVLPRDLRAPQQFFNPAAFVLPPPGRFGNAARNTIPGPGSVVFHLALGRFLRFGKDNQRRVDFRWEVQNLMNTPNFTGLGTVVNSTTYGRVLGSRPMRTMDLHLRLSF